MARKSRPRIYPRSDQLPGAARPFGPTQHALTLSSSELRLQRELSSAATRILAAAGHDLPLLGGIVRNVSEITPDQIQVSPLTPDQVAAALEPTFTTSGGRSFYATDADYVGSTMTAEHVGSRKSSWQPRQYRTRYVTPCEQPCHYLVTRENHRCVNVGRTHVLALAPGQRGRRSVGYWSDGGRGPVADYDDAQSFTIGAHMARRATFAERPHVSHLSGPGAIVAADYDRLDVVAEHGAEPFAVEYLVVNLDGAVPAAWVPAAARSERKRGGQRKATTRDLSADTLRRRIAESPHGRTLLVAILTAADEARRTGWTQRVAVDALTLAVDYNAQAPAGQRLTLTTIDGTGNASARALSSWRGRTAAARSALLTLVAA